MGKRHNKETKLLLKVVIFLDTKTDLQWFFTGHDAYLAIISKACPRMLSASKKKGSMMGNRPGIFDIFILDPSGPYSGTWIELKVGKNGLSKDQKVFAKTAEANGYYTTIARDSLDDFKRVMVEMGYSFKNKAIYLSRTSEA